MPELCSGARDDEVEIHWGRPGDVPLTILQPAAQEKERERRSLGLLHLPNTAQGSQPQASSQSASSHPDNLPRARLNKLLNTLEMVAYMGCLQYVQLVRASYVLLCLDQNCTRQSIAWDRSQAMKRQDRGSLMQGFSDTSWQGLSSLR